MTSISPWFRGYRRALRDVQRTIELYVRAMPEITSALSAVLMTADEIALELRYLKSEQFKTREQVQAMEDECIRDLRTDSATTGVSDRVQFDHGYRNGIDRALSIVSAYGLEMNDPNARVAIAEVAEHLARYKIGIAAAESGEIRTLRARRSSFPL